MVSKTPLKAASMCAAHAYHLLNLISHSQQQYLTCADGAKHVCCKELLKYSKHK